MKSTCSLIACAGILFASPCPVSAADQAPQLRETRDWIIISGINAGAGDWENGPLPWCYAIKKSTILSVAIDTHFRALSDKDHRPIRYHDASPEEIQNLPADLRVTTSELTSGPQNKIFHIAGLTHATAPAMLEKILAATGSPAAGTEKE